MKFIPKLLCACGASVSLEEPASCNCGRRIASFEDGLACLSATPYWGEVSQEEMHALLRECKTSPWRTAVLERAPQALHHYILQANRAAFQDVLPIPDGSTILDVGAGLGAIATHLAERHQVVALEGVRERAQFIQVRKQQDGLDNLTVINGDLNSVRLAPGQFDAVIVNGVLEWVGLFDLSAPPETVQGRFLSGLRELLSPDGYLYVGIENRFGWAQLRGTRDHSGLRYTSLMPRWMARAVCSMSHDYRSQFNTGYRTYTYSYRGYRKLFEQSGLDIAAHWIAPGSYNNPQELLPLNGAAIDAYTRARLMSPPRTNKDVLRNRLITFVATEWFWRWFGSDYAFLLRARPTNPADAQGA